MTDSRAANGGSGSSVPAQLRGVGAPGIAAIVVVLAGSLAGPPFGAVLVLIWARLSETPLARLGFTVPRRWGLSFALAILFGAVFKLVMKALVMPLLGAPAVNVAYHYLSGNAAALPALIVKVLVSAGFCEELLFRGYLFERLGRLIGRSRPALVATVVLSTALFALAHYEGQGLAGVEQAAVTGAVFGAIFARRREIGFVMVAHAVFDLTATALIFWNWEAAVAHLVFH